MKDKSYNVKKESDGYMELELFLEFINKCSKEINSDIEKLNSNKFNDKRSVFNHLSSEAIKLENYIKYFNQQNKQRTQEKTDNNHKTCIEQEHEATNKIKTFTLEELAKYDGKNGNRAYVAVRGVVYDVTNTPTWETLTHFGMSAGKDLTTPFASCHSATVILRVLPIVGRIV